MMKMQGANVDYLGVGDSGGDVEDDSLLLLPHLPGPGLVILPGARPLHQEGAGGAGGEDEDDDEDG